MTVENLLSELMSSGERESGIQPSSLRAMILYQATGGLYNMSHRINLLVSLYNVIARYQGVGGWKNRLVILRLAEVSEWWVGVRVWVQKLQFQVLHPLFLLRSCKSCYFDFCTVRSPFNRTKAAIPTFAPSPPTHPPPIKKRPDPRSRGGRISPIQI